MREEFIKRVKWNFKDTWAYSKPVEDINANWSDFFFISLFFIAWLPLSAIVMLISLFQSRKVTYIKLKEK